MGGFALSLVSGLSWGIGDFIGGLQARRLHSLSVLLVSQPVGLALVLTLIPLAGASFPDGREVALAAAAGVAGVLALGAFYRGLAIGTMSVVAPIASTGAVIPVAVGIASGDVPGQVQLAGVALAIAGVVVLGREEDDPAPLRRARGAIGLALVAAAGFGLFFVLLDAAATEAPLGATAVARAAGIAPVLLAIAIVRPGLPTRGSLPALATVGLFDVLANVTFALASTIGLLALVSVGGSLYPAFTILLAHLLLGERLSRPQWNGVAMALAGVLAIAAGG